MKKDLIKTKMNKIKNIGMIKVFKKIKIINIVKNNYINKFKKLNIS